MRSGRFTRAATQYEPVFHNNELDIRGRERSHYINWYSKPDSGDPDVIGMKYLAYTQGALINMTLLIPDRERENKEDYIWCIPVERVKWNKWYALADKFKTKTPQGVRYLTRIEQKKVKSVIIMPSGQHSDEDAEVACAFLRMVKNITCRMYVVRCTDDPPKGASLILAAAGAVVDFVDEVSDELTDEEVRPR